MLPWRVAWTCMTPIHCKYSLGGTSEVLASVFFQCLNLLLLEQWICTERKSNGTLLPGDIQSLSLRQDSDSNLRMCWKYISVSLSFFCWLFVPLPGQMIAPIWSLPRKFSRYNLSYLHWLPKYTWRQPWHLNKKSFLLLWFTFFP